MNIVQFLNVSKTIKGKIVLNNITFSSTEGQTIGIIGQNGAGKSTLLKIMLGLINPSSGKVLINNTNIKDNYKSIYDKIGFLIESPSLYQNLTGYENLYISLRLHNSKIEVSNSDIVELLKIKEYLNLKVKRYSMGMKQRLGIACALIHEPDIIILDEPTNSLDVLGVKEFRELIEVLKDKKKIIIIASHILKEVEEICTDTIIIDKGNIIDTSHIININRNINLITVPQQNLINLNEVLKDKAILYKENNSEKILVYSNNDLIDVLNLLSRNNIEILDIKEEKNNLEEYFIQKVGAN